MYSEKSFEGPAFQLIHTACHLHLESTFTKQYIKDSLEDNIVRHIINIYLFLPMASLVLFS